MREKWRQMSPNLQKYRAYYRQLSTTHDSKNAPCVRRPEASSWNSQLSVSLTDKSIVFRDGAKPPSGDTGVRVPQRIVDIESYHVCCWW